MFKFFINLTVSVLTVCSKMFNFVTKFVFGFIKSVLNITNTIAQIVLECTQIGFGIAGNYLRGAILYGVAYTIKGLQAAGSFIMSVPSRIKSLFTRSSNAEVTVLAAA